MMTELLGAGLQPVERGLHKGIWCWEHQKLKGNPLWQMVSISWTTQARRGFTEVVALGRGWTRSARFRVPIILCPHMGHYDSGLGFEIVLGPTDKT